MSRPVFNGTVCAMLVFATSIGVASANTPNLKLTLPFITSPRIDGDSTDIGWTEASQMGAKVVIDLNHNGNTRNLFPRFAYLGYDQEAIYFCFITCSPDPSKLSAGPAPWTYHGDAVEITLQPDPKKPQEYVYIGLGAGGHPPHVINFDGKKRDPVQIRHAMTKEGLFWRLEVAVPFAFLGVRAPKAGDVWKMNLTGHQRADENTYVCWNPTYGGFQNPRRFATMEFGK